MIICGVNALLSNCAARQFLKEHHTSGMKSGVQGHYTAKVFIMMTTKEMFCLIF